MGPAGGLAPAALEQRGQSRLSGGAKAAVGNERLDQFRRRHVERGIDRARSRRGQSDAPDPAVVETPRDMRDLVRAALLDLDLEAALDRPVDRGVRGGNRSEE